MEKFIFEFKEKSELYNEENQIDETYLNSLPNKYLNTKPLGLPQISEVSLVRHFTNLSQKNFGVDNGFYPLGSCTMKYNPKINEKIASDESLSVSHPLLDFEYVQGNLILLYQMEQFLKDITGMDAITFQPVAGAHGEVTGLMLIRAYHNNLGNHHKKNVIIPDSSHGTNPATASIAGYNVISIKSNPDGLVDLEKLQEIVNEETAALMLTNPNTLGLFEKDILKISEIIHKVGALLYYDGANFNPLLGRVKIASMGFDVVHLNLHKSFSTPHGGGGPGAGPVGVNKKLVDFLPVPRVSKQGRQYVLDYNNKKSIGNVHSFYGNFNVVVKAFFYILELGMNGLKATSEKSVLNANYLKRKLQNLLELPYKNNCLHEFVLSGKSLQQYGIHTIDLAKRIIDYGYHPPTIYFPLIVPEALMFEPVETESKATLDKFSSDFNKIIEEAKTSPELLLNAPQSTSVGRLDDVTAARSPILTYDQYVKSKT